jgi:hypothetical protein
MFGKHVPEPKKDDETHDQRERRTWKQKVHVDKNGNLFLPAFALKNGLESAAKWLSLKIPGERSKTYTKRFVSGVLVTENLPLTNGNGKAATMENIDPVELFVPSDGKRGSGTRVIKVFPTLHEWATSAIIHIFDNKITEDVLMRHLDAFGKFICFGAMRVENGGINGRCSVSELKWEEIGT